MGCVVCGVRYPELPLSEFHCNHIDPKTKAVRTGRGMMPSSGLLETNSRQELIDELVKCEVVCSKHHRQRERDNAKDYRQGSLFGGNGQAWIMRMLRSALPNSRSKGYHQQA